jgi:hypothetical protein
MRELNRTGMNSIVGENLTLSSGPITIPLDEKMEKKGANSVK